MVGGPVDDLWASFIDGFCDIGLDFVSFLVSFEGLGALGSDVGVQGRFLVKNGLVIREKTHSFGGIFSMFFSNFFDTVFEEAPGSKNHPKLVQK